MILLSTAQQPRHGYAILQFVESLSEGRIILSTGTLYGALSRLLEQGWIEQVNDSTSEIGRPRKEYTLTSQGRSLLKAELGRLRGLVKSAQYILNEGTA